MVIESKEEVFGWFKELSGAHRIEVLSTLVHSCIPLEWRFFASLVESLARRDYIQLLEDEHTANSATEMEALCMPDWLSDVVPAETQNGLMQPERSSVKQTAVTSDGTSVSRVPDPAPAGDALTAVTFHPQPQPPQTQKTSLITLRHKVIVSICLLNSTNRLCASIVFKAIQKHFSVENFQRHLQISVHGKERGKDKSVVVQTQVAAPDHELVAETTLLFTLALCHPAFSYEQQNMLSYQLKTVKEYLSSLGNTFTFSPAPSYYYHPHQYPTMPFPSAQFQSYYPITDPVPEPKVKSCYNCGNSGHLGQECREDTLDDMTRSADFNLNFAPPPLAAPDTETRNGPPVYTNHMKGRTASHPLHEQPASRSFATRDETQDDRGKSIHSSNQRDNFHDRSLNQGDQSGS